MDSKKPVQAVITRFFDEDKIAIHAKIYEDAWEARAFTIVRTTDSLSGAGRRLYLKHESEFPLLCYDTRKSVADTFYETSSIDDADPGLVIQTFVGENGAPESHVSYVRDLCPVRSFMGSGDGRFYSMKLPEASWENNDPDHARYADLIYSVIEQSKFKFSDEVLQRCDEMCSGSTES